MEDTFEYKHESPKKLKEEFVSAQMAYFKSISRNKSYAPRL